MFLCRQVDNKPCQSAHWQKHRTRRRRHPPRALPPGDQVRAVCGAARRYCIVVLVQRSAPGGAIGRSCLSLRQGDLRNCSSEIARRAPVRARQNGALKPSPAVIRRTYTNHPPPAPRIRSCRNAPFFLVHLPLPSSSSAAPPSAPCAPKALLVLIPRSSAAQGEEELIETESFIDGEWGEPQTVSFNQRDLLLYAVGIGCTEMKVSQIFGAQNSSTNLRVRSSSTSRTRGSSPSRCTPCC